MDVVYTIYYIYFITKFRCATKVIGKISSIPKCVSIIKFVACKACGASVNASIAGSVCVSS